MEKDFYRIKRLPPYVFAEVNAMKARERAAGTDTVDQSGMAATVVAGLRSIEKQNVTHLRLRRGNHRLGIDRIGVNGFHRAVRSEHVASAAQAAGHHARCRIGGAMCTRGALCSRHGPVRDRPGLW